MKDMTKVPSVRSVNRLLRATLLFVVSVVLGASLVAAATVTTNGAIGRTLVESAGDADLDSARMFVAPLDVEDAEPATALAGGVGARTQPGEIDAQLPRTSGEVVEEAIAQAEAAADDTTSGVAAASPASGPSSTSSSSSLATEATAGTKSVSSTSSASKSTPARPATTAAPTTAPTTTKAPAPTTTAAPATTKAPATTSAPTTAAPTTTKAPAPTTTNAPARQLLRVDFSRTGTGGYSGADVAADFGAIDWAVTDRATVVREGKNDFLRVTFPAGSVGPHEGGAQFVTDFENSIGLHDELYLSYKVRFADGFDFRKGGKLPGFGAGSAHSGGRQPDGYNGWSTRMMWVDNGSAISYVYHPDKTASYGDGMAWNASFGTGNWNTVETRVKLNTPGQRDGLIQGWMNGRLVFERTGLRFRDTANLKIENLFFSTFFGGNDSSWAAARNEHIDFDDFVVSTGPISH